MFMLQQGDCLLKKISENNLPNGNKEFLAHGILAEGESTGHSHQIRQLKTTFMHSEDNKYPVDVTSPIKMFKIGKDTFIESPIQFDVDHEEHKSISVPPGLYKLDIVREYDHFSEEARQVQD